VSKGQLITCIYCQKDRPPSKEHVLQKGLGGNLTIPDVCGECNNRFSVIDQSLAEESLVSLVRVGFAKTSGISTRLGGDHFRLNEAGYWEELKIVNGLQPVILPQIHLVGLEPNGQAQFAVVASEYEDLQQFLVLVDRRVADGSILKTHVKIGPSAHCTTARLVGHRRNEMYVRAETQEKGESFLRTVAGKWAGLRAQTSTSPPPQVRTVARPKVHVTQQICPDENYRAIAKIAFNVLAAKRGAQFVLRPEFDPIREYIQGANLVHQSPLPPGDVAVDTRFVRPLPMSEAPLIPTGSHAIAIAYAAPTLAGLVTLYEKYSFVVQLAEIQLAEQVIEAHEFSTDRTTNKALDIPELARRLWEGTQKKHT
jgi:hypothetical protein